MASIENNIQIKTPLPSASAPTAPAKQIKKLKLIGIFIGVIFVLAFGSRLVYNVFWFESTDDAYLQAHIHTISSRIPGYVKSVAVLENQKVKKGDILVRLDETDVEPAVREAQASAARAQKDVVRFRGYTEDLTPTDRRALDEYQASASVTDAQLTRARLQYQYTNIVAPEDGKVGRVSVETGDQILTGQALMPLIEPHPWVEANFKEGQIAHLYLGEEAEVTVDSIPGKVFNGKVDSIAPGSGAIFSLLPPDNATGNFTKIVQRIPVKITLDLESIKGFEDRLVSGMSTEVRVKSK
jgi:membrane fusion protein (multidrug efflux system)